MTKIKIQDDSGDREYFTIVPNYILNHSTHTDQALYLQMKRYAGEDGKCFATQETLTNKLGIGIKAYNKSLKYLLKKGWVEFVGLTGGKTRPIKTYKINNIWQENSDYYKKIPSESTVSKDTSQKEGDTSQKNNKIPPRSTVEEEPYTKKNQEEDNTAETSSALIGEIIKLFEEVNPACKNFYGNTTQRKACKNLLEEYGFEKVSHAISILPRSNRTAYLPTINTPLQLWEKYQALRDGVAKKKSELSAKGRGIA